MKILITNDDGIRAPGLIALVRSMIELGEVVVVAPHSQQSAVSHSITLHKPLRCVPESDFPVEGVSAYSTNGTPTDAILLGMHAVLSEKPHLVVSGINAGPNLGGDVTYSGTVAGAMEGVVGGIPSIAVSMGAFENLDYSECADFTRSLGGIVASGVFSKEVLLNVNYPNLPRDRIKGIAVTRLGIRWYDDVVHERVDPRGGKYYWITGKKVLVGRDPGTDAFELERGYISITPLSLDLTCTAALDSVAEILSCPSHAGLKDCDFAFEVKGQSAE